MNLKRALGRLAAPDEPGAQARAWEVIGAAYREQPRAVTHRRRRWLAFAPAAAVVTGVLTLTPAGATVGRLISHALGVPHAARALQSLPAPGRLLVSGPGGTWIVAADGSRTRLGAWRQASWSPHGRYVAVAAGDRLAAVDPHGVTRWALTRAAVADPRWYPPSGFRIAYRSGSALRVVAGDGTGDRQLAGGVAPVAPAWRPDHAYQLAYVQGDRVIVRDADTGRRIWSDAARGVDQLAWSADGGRLLVVARTAIRALGPDGRTIATINLSPASPAIDASLSPDGRRLAVVRGGVDPGVAVARLRSARPTLTGTLAGPGLRQVLFSPNGRWLLVSWPAADQWVFIAIDRTPRIAAVSGIARRFATGSPITAVPTLDGWCCTARGGA